MKYSKCPQVTQMFFHPTEPWFCCMVTYFNFLAWSKQTTVDGSEILHHLGMYKEPLKNMINASERRISEPATYQQYQIYQINDWSTYPPKIPR